MSRKIYEQILRNSGEGFLKVNAQKDENGNYIDFDILDYNKSFVDILKKMLKKNNLDIDILKDIIKDKFKANRQGIEIYELLERIEKNKFESINFGEKSYGINLKVDGYYLEEFFIFMCKLLFCF